MILIFWWEGMDFLVAVSFFSSCKCKKSSSVCFVYTLKDGKPIYNPCEILLSTVCTLAKQADNIRLSVCRSVCLFVLALLFDPFDIWPITSRRNLSVCLELGGLCANPLLISLIKLLVASVLILKTNCMMFFHCNKMSEHWSVFQSAYLMCFIHIKVWCCGPS